MNKFSAVLLLELSTVLYHSLGLSYDGSGSMYPNSNNEVLQKNLYYTPELDYKYPHWCHTLKLRNGHMRCSSPRGGNHRNSLGTRCALSCERGYKLLGQTSIQCMTSRRWSGTAYCRIVRCPVLTHIQQGSYSCSRGFFFQSRCDYSCFQGYQIEGDRYRVCQEGGSWSGAEPTCTDYDPPKLKCPLSRVKVAEPGKLTATVSWERPTAIDTADRSLKILLNGPKSGLEFSEGQHVIRYRVYDQARNMATCKFTVNVEGIIAELQFCPYLLHPVFKYYLC